MIDSCVQAMEGGFSAVFLDYTVAGNLAPLRVPILHSGLQEKPWVSLWLVLPRNSVLIRETPIALCIFEGQMVHGVVQDFLHEQHFEFDLFVRV